MATATPPTSKQRLGHLIFVLGAPGAGKGTNCHLLANDTELNGPRNLTVHHTSAGDLLRRQVAAGALPPALVEKVDKQILMNGRDITTIIAESGVLDRCNRGEEGVVVLDGFPRNMDQLRASSEQFGEPDLVLSLQCARQVAMKRFLGRRDASRPDGDEALFVKRCDEFERENPGILEYYRRTIPGRIVEVDIGSLDGVENGYNVLKQSLLKYEHGPWSQASGQKV
ncbi:unnamed protein product [Discula destructiva]